MTKVHLYASKGGIYSLVQKNVYVSLRLCSHVADLQRIFRSVGGRIKSALKNPHQLLWILQQIFPRINHFSTLIFFRHV